MGHLGYFGSARLGQFCIGGNHADDRVRFNSRARLVVFHRFQGGTILLAGDDSAIMGIDHISDRIDRHQGSDDDSMNIGTGCADAGLGGVFHAAHLSDGGTGPRPDISFRRRSANPA